MSSGLEALTGSRLQRLDSPAADVLSLVLTRPGRKQILLARLRGSPLGVGLVQERPTGAAASPAITKLRHHLRGARLSAIRICEDRRLRATFVRGDQQTVLELSFAVHAGNCILSTATGRLITRLHHEPPPPPAAAPHLSTSTEELVSMGRRLAESLVDPLQDPERQALRKAIERRIGSLQRRLVAIRGDAARAQQAPELRELATLIMSQLRTITIEGDQLKLVDYRTDPPCDLHLDLISPDTPRQLAERWFARARKFERGAHIARRRASETHNDITALQELLLMTDRDDAAGQPIETIKDRAACLGVRGMTAHGGTRKQARQRMPFREFRSRDGQTVLVGRNARENDRLTLQHARPHDLFVHVRDRPGAHVIVPLKQHGQCPPQTLIDAAMLASHFSACRGESPVDVCYVSRRHLRKVKGTPPGQVLLQRERVLALRPDAKLIQQLLASERIR